MTIEFPAMIEFEVESIPKKFQLDFSICENPDCDCNSVNMVLYNDNKDIKFFLDFKTGAFRENNHNEADGRILNSFISFLGKSPTINLDFFKKNYKYVKEKVNARKEAIISFELGTFLMYREIMWKEDDLKIDIDGKSYIIIDSYCVTPGCKCNEALLNFAEKTYKIGDIDPDFCFVYDYINGSDREPNGIDDAKAGQIIGKFPESLRKKFKQRHATIKKEVKKDIEKKIKEKAFIPEKTEKRKLGRNEPCHCGSGKKYKKCCLNSDIEKYGKAVKVDY